MTKKEYPVLSQNYKIHLTPEGGYLEGIGLKEFRRVNSAATEILLLCNGRNTIEDITRKISSSQNMSFEDLIDIVQSFIKYSVEFGDVLWSSKPVKHIIKTSGSKEYFSPVTVSFETTSRCNEKCLHCYRSCTSNPQEQELDLEDVEKLLYIFSDNGIYNIELTGGELLMNKNIDRIVELSCDYFGSVSLLTNGTLITETFLDKIEKYKNRIMIQIPLESLFNPVHDEFRGLQGSAIRTKKNIKMCSDRGFKVRAAAVMTPSNLTSLEETVKYSIEKLKVIGFSLSSILPIGRGKEYIDSWGFDQEKYEQFIFECNDTIIKLQDRYPNHVIKLDPEEINSTTTCGICRDSICVDPSGNIRTCVSCSSDLLYLGNVLNDDWEKICTSDKYLKLQQILWPTENSEYCKSCTWVGFCSRCNMRAITKNIELFQENEYICPWAKENNLLKFIENESNYKNTVALQNL